MIGRVRSLCRQPGTWIVLLTVLYSVSLATGSNPYPSDPQEWRWPGRPPALSTLPRWWPALLVLVGYVALGLWLDRRCRQDLPRWRITLALALLVLAAPLIQICLVYIHNPYTVAFYLQRTTGPHNGFWQIASTQDSLPGLLRGYPDLMRNEPYVHTTTHPPGNVLYVWLWRMAYRAWPAAGQTVAHWLRQYRCSDIGFVSMDNDQIASATAQMSIPLFSGLTVIPLFALGRRLGGVQVGMRAAVFYVVVPSLTLFTMRWDQVYPLLLCLALYWLHRGVTERQAGFFLLAGIAVSVGSFTSFGNLTVLPALALYALLHLLAGGASRWRQWLAGTWRGWLLFVLACSSLWVAYHAISGNSFWDLFSTAMSTHLNLGRRYWIWVLLNPYEFLTFLGVPVCVLFVAEAWRTWRRTLSRPWLAPSGPAILTLAVTGTVLAMNLSGVTRGEVARIWLLWMAPACLIAAFALAGAAGKCLYTLGLTLMACSTLMATLFLRVSATGLPDYQPRQVQRTVPSGIRPLEARFGEEIALVGAQLPAGSVVTGERMDVTLVWQALGRTDRPYTVFVHVVDASGAMWAQQDAMPLENTLPTTCWVEGEIVRDVYAIDLPTDMPAGEYWIEVGWYWLPSRERLPASGLDATSPDRLLLGPVSVARSAD